jgi:uncharacterized protein
VVAEALDVAAVLREARDHAGLSQTDLGERTGIAQPNISAYESGRRTPTVRTLVALLDACDVELSWRARD